MNLTVEELAERLATMSDEVSILEVLNINSFDLVARFQDRIEANYDALIEDMGLDDETSEEE